MKTNKYIKYLILIIFLTSVLTNQLLAADSINDEIIAKQKQIEELKRKKELYEKSLSKTRQQINTLAGQITNLDQTIDKVNLEIKTVSLEIEETNLQTQQLQEEIAAAEKIIEDHQQIIADLLRLINRRSYYQNNLTALLTNDSLGAFFNHVNQINKINNSLKQKVDDLDSQKVELTRQNNLLTQKHDELIGLQNQLSSNEEKLNSDITIKNSILKQTKGEESKYTILLNQLKKEQQQINSEIYNLEIKARKKLLESNSKQFLASEKGFIWPSTSRLVTAYFHDPDYPYRHVFEHPAIDIAMSQGSAVRAIKSGYVAKVKNTGNSGNYNYIMLVHSDGISSVYGHLNRMIVAEDTFIVQGEIIGYSGGMPGTAGAGNLTTGAHLHLEVRSNGIPVNPLDYLP